MLSSPLRLAPTLGICSLPHCDWLPPWEYAPFPTAIGYVIAAKLAECLTEVLRNLKAAFVEAEKEQKEKEEKEQKEKEPAAAAATAAATAETALDSVASLPRQLARPNPDQVAAETGAFTSVHI
eukprot:1755669-Pyramimonas_sp.AAC.1